MLNFIVEVVYVCPDGSKTGKEHRCFSDIGKLEEFLIENNNSYSIKTLIGCEVK